MKPLDSIFSFETIYKDSNKNKVYFYNHLTHLLIHSFLHVNDFVHKKLKDYLMMKKIEISVLKKLKIDNPYIQFYARKKFKKKIDVEKLVN